MKIHKLVFAFALLPVAFLHAQQAPAIMTSCPANTVAPGAPVTASFQLVNLPDTFSPTIRWSLLSAPAGFSLTPAQDSATVSGLAPGSSGTYTISVEATYFVNFSSQGGGGQTVGPATCSFTVQGAPPLQIMGTCPTTSFAPGAAVNIPLQASGGSGRYAWSVASQGAGFSVSSETGATTAIQGTLGQTSASFTVTLSDLATQGESSVTFSCTLNVGGSTTGLAISGACPATTFAPGAAISIPLTATGGSGQYAWQISAGNSGLTLSSTSGGATIVQGAPAAGRYTFTVTLTDASPSARASTPVTFTCTITVGSPLQITGTCPTQAFAPGSPVSIPLSVTGGVAPYTWTVSGPLTASATTGSSIMLSGSPSASGNMAILATVQDSIGSTPATFSCTLRVIPPLTITGPPCPIPSVVAGRSFTIPFTAAGGSGTYSWTVTGPAFLALTSGSGASTSLTGSAPNGGSFPFTVTVTDGVNTQTYSCSLQVAPLLTLGPATLPNGLVNQVYPTTTLTASGGQPPLTFSVTGGNLPPGLQLDPVSGAISGTPTQAGTFSFTVTVTDSAAGSAQQTATGNFQITVNNPITNTTACPLPVGHELQQYNAPLTATGGNGQYTFSLANNSLLPPGLSIDKNTIIGTPIGPSDTVLMFQITSGTQTTAPFSCELKVLGRVPDVTVNGFFMNIGSPLVTSTIMLDAPVQQDVTGTAVLSFTPDVPNSAIKDNPQVQFCAGNAGDPSCSGAQKDASGLLRVLPFTIPAGTQSLDLSPALMSNVAGTITLTLTNVMMGGQAITVAPLQFTIPRTPPTILAQPTASFAGSVLNIAMKVSSSTCELSSATAVFSPTPGSEFEGSGGGNFTSVVDLTGVFKNFTPFAVDATHPTGGCAFTLTLPFNISGDTRAISTVSITLTNAAGNSQPNTIALQP